MANRRRTFAAGFTLLEVLVAMVVLSLMVAVTLGIISQTSSVTQSASAKITSFQEARAGFEMLTRRLSQATLNPYWDFDNPLSPGRYLRRSELHFLIGPAGVAPFSGTLGTGQAIAFQSPTGQVEDLDGFGNLELLLNGTGYFIEYSAEEPLPAPFPAPSDRRYRYRLMQVVQPSERLAVYSEGTTGDAWVSSLFAAGSQIAAVAENVVHLILWPRLSPADDPDGSQLTSGFGNAYAYDSRANAIDDPQPIHAHQLPPIVQVTMIAIDEPSAQRFCLDGTPPAVLTAAFNGLFETATRSAFEADIGKLEQRLSENQINFRVFNALVPLRESRMQ